MDFNANRNLLETPLQVFRTITKKQAMRYIMQASDADEPAAEAFIRFLEKGRRVFCDEYTVRISPKSPVDKKGLIAFWVLLERQKEVGEKIFNTRYPHSGAFAIDTIQLITVCEGGNFDRELLAFKEKEKSEHERYIIAGDNLSHREINKELLPDCEYEYCRVDFNSILEDVPEITKEV